MANVLEKAKKLEKGARIVAPFSMHGQVLLDVNLEDPMLLLKIKLFQDLDNNIFTLTRLRPARSKSHKNRWIASFKEISSRTLAEQSQKKDLFFDHSRLPKLDPEDGLFYAEELEGLALLDQQGYPQGKVLRVVNFPNHECSSLELVWHGHALFLPFIQSFFPEFQSFINEQNLTEKGLVFNPPDNWIEL